MNTRPLERATYSAFITSVVFWLLFQLSKLSMIGDVSPFAEDPYDAVASFAFQIAMAIALLSLSRLVSIKDENGLRQRAPFILRGILLVEVSVAVTLVTDFIAILPGLPLTISTPTVFLLCGLSLLMTLFTITGFFLAHAWNQFKGLSVELPRDALGQTLRDCWMLVTVIANWFVARLLFLRPVWNRSDSLAHKIAGTWNTRLPFANPDQNPWGFAVTFAVLVGFFIMAVIMLSEGLSEGGPATPAIALLLAGVFFAGETIAILLSFLFFGGYLGLRSRLGHR